MSVQKHWVNVPHRHKQPIATRKNQAHTQSARAIIANIDTIHIFQHTNHRHEHSFAFVTHCNKQIETNNYQTRIEIFETSK